LRLIERNSAAASFANVILKFLRSDLVDIVRRPAGFTRRRLALEEQNCLADTAEPSEDQTRFVVAATHTVEQHPELIEFLLPTGELAGLPAGSRGVRIVGAVHVVCSEIPVRRRPPGVRA
jgi:hypothetical protein